MAPNMSALGKYYYKQMMNGNTPESKKERNYQVFDNTGKQRQRPLGEWVTEDIGRRGLGAL